MSIWSAFNTGLLISQTIRQSQMEKSLKNVESAAVQNAARLSQLNAMREMLHVYKNRLSRVEQQQTVSIDDAVTMAFFRYWISSNNVSSVSFPELIDKEYFANVHSLAERVGERCNDAFSVDDIQVVEQLARVEHAKFFLTRLAAWTKIRGMMWGGRAVWTGWSWGWQFLFLLIVILVACSFIAQLATHYIGVPKELAQTILNPFWTALLAGVIVFSRSIFAGFMKGVVKPLGGNVSSRASVSEIDAIVRGFRESSSHAFTQSNEPAVALLEIENRERKEVLRLGVSDWNS